MPWSTTVETYKCAISFVEGSAGDDATTDFEKQELGVSARLHACVAEYPDANDFPVQNVYNEVIPGHGLRYVGA